MTTDELIVPECYEKIASFDILFSSKERHLFDHGQFASIWFLSD